MNATEQLGQSNLTCPHCNGHGIISWESADGVEITADCALCYGVGLVHPNKVKRVNLNVKN